MLQRMWLSRKSLAPRLTQRNARQYSRWWISKLHLGLRRQGNKKKGNGMTREILTSFIVKSILGPSA
jgi:hypothetical protein